MRPRTASTRSASWTSCCTELARERSAQATVEAAFLLPTFLVLLLLALQPVCILYTRSVMESAASETARLMVTAQEDNDMTLKAFAVRRLQAVPDLDIFHAGGPASWDVRLTRAEDTGGAVGVSIKGYVTPLPVLGAFVSAFGKTNIYGDVEMEVTVAYEGRPSWLEGDYETWMEMWEEEEA